MLLLFLLFLLLLQLLLQLRLPGVSLTQHQSCQSLSLGHLAFDVSSPGAFGSSPRPAL